MMWMITNIWIIKNVIVVKLDRVKNCVLVDNQNGDRAATISTSSSLYHRLNREDGEEMQNLFSA